MYPWGSGGCSSISDEKLKEAGYLTLEEHKKKYSKKRTTKPEVDVRREAGCRQDQDEREHDLDDVDPYHNPTEGGGSRPTPWRP